MTRTEHNTVLAVSSDEEPWIETFGFQRSSLFICYVKVPQSPVELEFMGAAIRL